MNIAVILAGGMGLRMGVTDKPKQFMDIYGKPLIIHTIESFDMHPEIDNIAIVCVKEWFEDLKIWIRKFELNKVKWIVEGGASRQESVFNGLESIKNQCNDDDIIVIHDAARPLVSKKVISDNIEMAKKFGSVDTVIPTPDTIIKSIDSQIIAEIPQRKSLYLGQTPQSFRYSIIRNAHLYAIENGIKDATDDCQLVLKTGKDTYLVMGDKLNFKITTMDDLLLLKAIIKLGKLEVI